MGSNYICDDWSVLCGTNERLSQYLRGKKVHVSSPLEYSEGVSILDLCRSRRRRQWQEKLKIADSQSLRRSWACIDNLKNPTVDRREWLTISGLAAESREISLWGVTSGRSTAASLRGLSPALIPDLVVVAPPRLHIAVIRWTMIRSPPGRDVQIGDKPGSRTQWLFCKRLSLWICINLWLAFAPCCRRRHEAV